jgi:hypothetical protein
MKVLDVSFAKDFEVFLGIPDWDHREALPTVQHIGVIICTLMGRYHEIDSDREDRYHQDQAAIDEPVVVPSTLGDIIEYLVFSLHNLVIV